VQESYLNDWVPYVKGKSLTNVQIKARRIWHKGSVLTWAVYLRDIICFSLQIMTSDEREKMLYRHQIDEHHKAIIKQCLSRLFSHPMWDELGGELDSLLSASKKQDDLFKSKGLTDRFVIYGTV
jgi:hypothetical protein